MDRIGLLEEIMLSLAAEKRKMAMTKMTSAFALPWRSRRAESRLMAQARGTPIYPGKGGREQRLCKDDITRGKTGRSSLVPRPDCARLDTLSVRPFKEMAQPKDEAPH